TLLRALTVDLDRPRLGLQPTCAERRRLFVRAELVIVVVRGDLFPAVGFFLLWSEAEWARLDSLQLAAMRRDLTGRAQLARPGNRPGARRRDAGGRSQEFPAVQVPFLSGNFRTPDVGGFFDQHNCSSINTMGTRDRLPRSL